MKFCDKCGYKLKDDEKYCPSCGADTSVSKTKHKKIKTKIKTINTKINTVAANKEYYAKKTTEDLQNAARAFMILTCVIMIAGAFITEIYSCIYDFSKITGLLWFIPLVWCLLMTISYDKKVDNNEYVGVSFKICVLLFVSFIAGILMLCDNSN